MFAVCSIIDQMTNCILQNECT